MTPDIEPLWTWKEVANFLGVGRSTVFKLVAETDLPCAHVGRQLRFSPARVRQWFEVQSKPAKLTGAT
jgi:excisionase family DNA binding protein